MRDVALDARLRSVAEFVPQGAKVADVGTDHAYLPIALCREGRVSGAVASDVNRGPLETARKNIAAAGLSDRIETRLCDGLQGLEDTFPDAIMICGMGGELIASILDAAPWIRLAGMRLILQPMTHPQDLRAWLAANGFAVIGEKLSLTDRIYVTVCAEYDGTVRRLSLPETYFGEKGKCERDALYLRRMREMEKTFTAIRDAKRGAGQDTSTEDELLGFIKEELK